MKALVWGLNIVQFLVVYVFAFALFRYGIFELLPPETGLTARGVWPAASIGIAFLPWKFYNRFSNYLISFFKSTDIPKTNISNMSKPWPSKLLYTFFFGYAPLKWRRLINTIFLIIAAFVLFVQQDHISNADSRRENLIKKQDKMNQQAIQDEYILFKLEGDQEVLLQDLFNRAVYLGYKKTIEDFSALIVSDREVLQDNYNYVKSQGYKKTIEDFEVLVGVKKTYESVESVLDSDSEADSYYIATVKSGIFFSILAFLIPMLLSWLIKPFIVKEE